MNCNYTCRQTTSLIAGLKLGFVLSIILAIVVACNPIRPDYYVDSPAAPGLFASKGLHDLVRDSAGVLWAHSDDFVYQIRPHQPDPTGNIVIPYSRNWCCVDGYLALDKKNSPLLLTSSGGRFVADSLRSAFTIPAGRCPFDDPVSVDPLRSMRYAQSAGDGIGIWEWDGDSSVLVADDTLTVDSICCALLATSGDFNTIFLKDHAGNVDRRTYRNGQSSRIQLFPESLAVQLHAAYILSGKDYLLFTPSKSFRYYDSTLGYKKSIPEYHTILARVDELGVKKVICDFNLWNPATKLRCKYRSPSEIWLLGRDRYIRATESGATVDFFPNRGVNRFDLFCFSGPDTVVFFDEATQDLIYWKQQLY